MQKIGFNIILLLFLGNMSFGQKALYTNYTHYNTEKGLPQSYVTGIQQDKQGFIWVSTMDGLARFDGKKFLRFSADNSDVNLQISTSYINSIYIDDRNNLWVYNFNDVIDKINLNNYSIEKDVAPYISVPIEDFFLATSNRHAPPFFNNDDNKLWFAGGPKTFRLYDSTNAELVNYFSRKRTDTALINGFAGDDNGNLYTIIGRHTLKRLDASGEVTLHPFEIKQKEYKNSNYQYYLKMIALNNEKVFFFVTEGILRPFIFDNILKEMRRVQIPEMERTGSDIYIKCFAKSQNGELYFNYRGAVFKLTKDEKVLMVWNYPFQPRLNISSLLIDKSETLWIGTNTGGLFSIDLNKPQFEAFEYKTNFIVDILNNHYNKDFEIPSRWNKNKWAYGLRTCYDTNGDLFITNEFGYSHGKYVFQNGKALPKMIPDEEERGFLFGIDIQDKFIWSITQKGKIVKFQKDGTFLNSTVIIKSNSENDEVVDLVVDNQHQWIITKWNKLLQLKDGQVIKTFETTNSNYSQVDLSEDHQDNSILWIGTRGGGLIKWDKANSKVIATYSTEQGLPNNNVAAIVQDKDGYLWISTFNGIAKFDTQNERFISYNTSDGLHESEFNRHHSFLFPDGRIAFGGPMGYTLFNPANFNTKQFQPKVNVASLKINEEPYQGALNNLEELNLAYNQNWIEIEAAAMQFTNPEINNYRYQLVGFNDDWVYNDNDRKIKFDQLLPGNYTLKINATNTNGVWSEHIRTININIAPPPWLSWWAYLLYTTTSFSVVYIYWRSYKKRIRRKQEEEFNKREAKRLREIDEIKTRFFSNITHEFRTPLTLILSPLEKHLHNNDLPKVIRKTLQTNYEQGSKLLLLVNQLLDIAKLESGNMMVHNAAGKLDIFVKTCIDPFQSLAQDKEIKLSFINENVGGLYLFGKGHWEKIIYNLMSNALKFTNEGGDIIVTINDSTETNTTINQFITLKIEDNGIGIKEGDMNNLFDRFYQVDDSETRSNEGTGIGLALVKELTDLLGGKINVESKEGIGTKFTLKLPATSMSETPPQVTQLDNFMPPEPLPRNNDSPLILVVEDNKHLRSFIVESLSEEWHVIDAPDAESAQTLIESELPNIIISDVMMPGISGIELCNITKNDPRTSHISFIMLTAKTAQESKEKGLDAGADAYLTKPFHLHELQLRIHNLIQQQRNLREYLQTELLPKSPIAKVGQIDDQFIKKLYHFLDENIGSHFLGIETLCMEMAMSKSTLNRKLKTVLGISPNDLIKQYRLQQAAVLLQNGNTIAEVAYQVGFESHSYFSQCFKDQYQQSPSEFQKQLN